MMDLWQLTVFCKVVDYKSFSKAGKKIHLSQPTVSSHIKELEDHFGCRLIDRLSKEALPTKAGELLYDYARKLIALRDETETALAEFQGKVKGRLKIGGSTIPGVYIIPEIIGNFVKKYPEVTISLVIGDTEKIINDTVSGVLELGIVGAKTKNPNASQEKLMEDNMCLIVPGDHKWADKTEIDINMLSKEPFIIREQGSGTLKSIQKSLGNTDFSLEEFRIIAEMGSTAAVIQSIKNHVGVSILSPVAAGEEICAGTLKSVAVKGLDLKRSFYLTTRKNRTLSTLAGKFIDFMKQNLPV